MCEEAYREPDFGRFEDAAPFAEFLTDSPNGDPLWRTHLIPAMRDADVAVCRTQYRYERRIPTCGELRLLNTLVALRRRSPGCGFLSQVQLEQDALRQTYDDLLQKLRYREPNRTLPPTLEEASRVCTSYLRMIGIGVADAGRQAPQLPIPTETALLLITDTQDARPSEDRLADFLTSEAVRPLYRERLTVGTFGLIGLLAQRCGGVFLDPDRLPHREEEPLSPSALAEAYHGCTVIGTNKQSVSFLEELAGVYGLRIRYFAKATQSGKFRVKQDTPLSMELTIPFLRRLLSAKEAMEATLPEQSLKSVCPHRLLRSPAGTYTLRCEAERNCFSAALNTVLNSVITILPQGVDRRSLVLSLDYALPAEGTDRQELGQTFSLILGAYRATMELALPEENSRLRYTEDGNCALSCTVRSRQKATPLPDTAREAGTSIGYLSFRREADGMPDFESVRQSCDLFSRLAREGRVLSARAVFGDPLVAMKKMGANRPIRPTPLAEEYRIGFCQGWLLELREPANLPVLGTVADVPICEDAD